MQVTGEVCWITGITTAIVSNCLSSLATWQLGLAAGLLNAMHVLKCGFFINQHVMIVD